MRADLNGTGVRVTSIEPGNTETEFSVRFKGDAEKAEKVYAGETERVAMTGDDIAEVIHFRTPGSALRQREPDRADAERQGLGPFTFDRSQRGFKIFGLFNGERRGST